MSQLKFAIDTYSTNEGIYPTVFKKMDSSDVSINAFQVYKHWTFMSGSDTSSALPLTAIYSNINNLPALQTELTYNDASNIDGSLQSVMYFSINHLFYKYKDQPINTFGAAGVETKRYLFQSASILSIPQMKIGEGIKVASFNLSSTVSGSFASDLYDNVYDTSINTSSIISNVKFYEGFNEYFDNARISYDSTGVTYVPGVITTTGQQKSIGLAAQFDGSGSIQTTIPGFYDRNHDFAISFFVSGANSNSQLLIGKRNDISRTRYPFEIYNDNNNIRFDTMLTYVSASVSSSWTHILCQKTGSYMQIYRNGTLIDSIFNPLYDIPTSPLSSSNRIDNLDFLNIGGYSGSNSFGFTGKLDEIRIFNKALSLTEINYLADMTEGGTLLQTRNVGTVFSKQGIVVFSSPDYRYQDLLNTPFTASYRSTKTIYELSAIVRVDAGDLNMSTNISLTNDDDTTYKSYVSSSNFMPYITTIGLYNDYGQLLAIGKLAQPIRKRNDVDLNFLVKLDLDMNVSLKTQPGIYK